MSCDEKTYYYKNLPAVIASKYFEVTGKEKRSVTQFLQVDLGHEFIYSPGLAVVVK
jgi:hypothetical protein